MEEFDRGQIQAPHKANLLEAVTVREEEVLRLLAAGSSHAEIAKALFVEPTAVTSHLGRTLTKTGA